MAKKEFKELKLSDVILKRYVGKYQLAPQFFISVSIEEGHLYAQATGQQKFELFAYDKDEFFLKVVDAQIKFNIENSEVISLTLIQNGKTEGKKIE